MWTFSLSPCRHFGALVPVLSWRCGSNSTNRSKRTLEEVLLRRARNIGASSGGHRSKCEAINQSGPCRKWRSEDVMEAHGRRTFLCWVRLLVPSEARCRHTALNDVAFYEWFIKTFNDLVALRTGKDATWKISKNIQKKQQANKKPKTKRWNIVIYIYIYIYYAVRVTTVLVTTTRKGISKKIISNTSEGALVSCSTCLHF